MIMPPWTPPQLLHPTRTGTIVDAPAVSVVIHVLSVHNIFVLASIDKSGGAVVMVESMISAVEGKAPVVDEKVSTSDAWVGGPGGGGGNGRPSQPKTHGNCQPHPPEPGYVIIPTASPAAFVVVEISVEDNEVSVGIQVGVYEAVDAEAIIAEITVFDVSVGVLAEDSITAPGEKEVYALATDPDLEVSERKLAENRCIKADYTSPVVVTGDPLVAVP